MPGHLKKNTHISRLKGMLRSVPCSLAPSPVYNVVEEAHPDADLEKLTLLSQIHRSDHLFYRYTDDLSMISRINHQTPISYCHKDLCVMSLYYYIDWHWYNRVNCNKCVVSPI